MQKNMVKKGLVCGIILLFAGASIIPSMSVMVNIPKENEKSIILTHFENAVAEIDIAESKNAEKITNYSSAASSIATPVVTGVHPAIASDSVANIVLGFEDDIPSVSFTASSDRGESWAAEAVSWGFPEPPKLPEIDNCGDDRFIGGMVPDYLDNDGGILYKVMVSDSTSIPDGYTLVWWVWNNNGFTNFISIGVGGYTAEDPYENTWAYGGHSIVGDHASSARFQAPFYSYQVDDSGVALMYSFDVDYNGCEITAHDIDLMTLESYAVWNYNNSGTGDLFFYKFDFSIWEPYPPFRKHPDIGGGTINTAGNDDYIDVSAHDDNVVIVSQRDGDTVAYYSFNGLDTVEEITIETGAVNPRIVHIYENIFICIFIKEEILYYSITEDGGSTWSESMQVDDEAMTVPEEYKSADICGFGAAWMSSEDTIYFASSLEPVENDLPLAPIITGVTEGIAGIEYDFQIVTIDPDGNAIYYFIDWGDETNSNWLGPYASGEEAVIDHMWISEGEYEITAKARDIYNSEGNWSDPWNVTIVEDTQPPVTTIYLDGPMGENDWFIGCVTVVLSATDDLSGVADTYYRLNGTWLVYTGPFEICEDGVYTLEYYSVDNVGNEEEVKIYNLKIDQTNPDITLTVEKVGFVKWLFTAIVSDETSGINRVQFYLDNELLGEVNKEPYEYIWFGSGSHTVKAIVFDNAGNQGVSDEVESESQSHHSINSLFLRFLERFPNAFPILRYILELQ